VAWAFYDWASSGFAALIQTFVFAAYFTQRVAANEAIGNAQWGLTISGSGLVVALTGPVLGAIADQDGRRKPWLVAFTALCVTATALLWWIEPSTAFAWRAIALVALATIGTECAGIFYNAMLPRLAGPARLGRWSGIGWGLGYAGGLLCLVVALVGFVRADQPWVALDRTAFLHVRATVLLAAGWYLVFALPLILLAPDTPGTGKPFRQAVRDGLRQLRDSCRSIRRYGHLVRFLIARMCYVDGLATVFTFGGVYAAGTFGMNEQQVLTFGIALNVTAGIGAALFGLVDDRIGSRRVILLSLTALLLLGSLMLVAPSQGLFWVIGMALGLFVGPVQASSRAFFARMAPEALHNQMFGLYAFSGRATAFLGPLLVGVLTYATGSQRLAMSSILVFFLAGLILMRGLPSKVSDTF
jgi:UMF1 family MFS transporter